jgi:uncharacterized protein (TIGR03792 family)
MVIEWLTFEVDPENREKFIQIDEEIWTAVLSQYPGFIAKEVWISPENLGQVVFVVHWQTREQWKSIPQEDLEAVGQRFDAAVKFDYAMVDSREYQVRRFPQS